MDELINDLIINTGIFLIGWLNRIYSNASDIARRSDYPFSEMVKKAGTRYKRGPKNSGTTYSINAASEITIYHVVPVYSFNNQGNAVLTFCAGPEIAGKVKHLRPARFCPETR